MMVLGEDSWKEWPALGGIVLVGSRSDFAFFWSKALHIGELDDTASRL